MPSRKSADATSDTRSTHVQRHQALRIARASQATLADTPSEERIARIASFSRRLPLQVRKSFVTLQALVAAASPPLFFHDNLVPFFGSNRWKPRLQACTAPKGWSPSHAATIPPPQRVPRPSPSAPVSRCLLMSVQNVPSLVIIWTDTSARTRARMNMCIH